MAFPGELAKVRWYRTYRWIYYLSCKIGKLTKQYKLDSLIVSIYLLIFLQFIFVHHKLQYQPPSLDPFGYLSNLNWEILWFLVFDLCYHYYIILVLLSTFIFCIWNPSNSLNLHMLGRFEPYTSLFKNMEKNIFLLCNF